jgi:hypothetical protein
VGWSHRHDHLSVISASVLPGLGKHCLAKNVIGPWNQQACAYAQVLALFLNIIKEVKRAIRCGAPLVTVMVIVFVLKKEC